MTELQVVDRRDIIPKRKDRYLSFPGMVRLGGDELLLGYRQARSAPGTRSHGTDGDFMLMRFSRGQWSEPKLLYRHEATAEEMGCGDLALTADGTVTLWSRQWSHAEHRTRDSYFATSRDGGRTFSPRRAVRFDFFPNGWAPYGKVIEPAGGTWLQGGYGVRPGEAKSSAACLASRDGGESWRLRAWIAEGSDPAGLNYYEPFIYLLPDGSLLCLLRTNGTFHCSRSGDGGRSWSPPEATFQGMACAGLILSTVELVVAYRGIHEQHPDRVRENVTERRGRLYCCRVSDDGGASWGPEVEIDGNTAWQIGSYGMGDLVELDDGRVLAVYYTSDADQAPWLRECTLARR